MLACVLLLSSCLAALVEGLPWYHGIDSIHVLSPPQSKRDQIILQEEVNGIYEKMEEDAHGNTSAFQKGQFGKRRRAILLRTGDYHNLTIPVNWYTSLMGVGVQPRDVRVRGILSKDAYPGSEKGCLENFWKSAEGLTTSEDVTLWAVSQAAPLRRAVIGGDLLLSETDAHSTNNGSHFASGGFLADVQIGGSLNWGDQQQFFFRNSEFANVDYTSAGQSMVFVGVTGAPSYNTSMPKPLISNVFETPSVAEKPYLVEHEGEWYIVVPEVEHRKRGVTSAWSRFGLRWIPIDRVFVAREGDTADDIARGIVGKQALLLTPAIYGLQHPIRISQPGFVVLGIGMPTLVALQGLSAIVVDRRAYGVRIAQVLLEAGTPLTVDATEPLLSWRGDRGVASDLFARVGAFSYQTDFHPSCLIPKVDIMVKVDGDGVIFDNAWLWHADHDDCTLGLGTAYADPPKSDEAFSATGLLVNGDNVIGYGLAVEHTKHDLLQWEGENGKVFFFQSELPYRSNLDFGTQGWVGFKVGYDVESFDGFGIGVYQVFNTFAMNASFRISPNARIHNMFAWCITGNASGLGSLACTSPGSGECTSGDCDKSSCQVIDFPNSALGDRISNPFKAFVI
eukprot:TRINITY_DN74817_c0_g1_i1.p1 TRINITY_DN74817_c0_g1~~TRINITY_DN74817_c0_g1_i1.p1  ORF type:complete len:621 (-),score=51.79 TRINITY_DN74817_c0_g1_i1:214-2076(-)